MFEINDLAIVAAMSIMIFMLLESGTDYGKTVHDCVGLPSSGSVGHLILGWQCRNQLIVFAAGATNNVGGWFVSLQTPQPSNQKGVDLKFSRRAEDEKKMKLIFVCLLCKCARSLSRCVLFQCCESEFIQSYD